jgi:flagellar hook-associated protein 2
MGVAEQLSKAMQLYLGDRGVLESRTKGLNQRIEDINKQREQLARRLETTEKRLMKQFSSLDATLGKMRSTSNFLSTRLEQLPGVKEKDK